MKVSQPMVKAYPLCSECQVPWVLRRCYSIRSGKSMWLWQRDCKHRSALAAVVEERPSKKRVAS